MRKHLKSIAIAASIILISLWGVGFAKAVNVTVPAAPGYGYGLVSTSTGAYIYLATSTVTCGTGITCAGSAGSLLGGTNLTISASGGSGNGNVATSTGETAGQLAYWTSTNGTPALLGKVATSSLNVTGPITFSGTLGAQIGGIGGNFACATCLTSATIQSTSTNPFMATYFVATSTTLASQFPYASSTAWSITSTSTGSKGINLSGGCFAVAGTCIGGGAGTNYWAAGSDSNGIYPGGAGSPSTNIYAGGATAQPSGFGSGGTGYVNLYSLYTGSSVLNLNQGAANVAILGAAESDGGSSGNSSVGVYGYATSTNGGYGESSFGVLAENKGENATFSPNIASPFDAALYAIQDNLFTTTHKNYAVYATGGENYFGGNTGFGTTSPYSLLSLAGTSGIVASTTATSTFIGGGINLTTSAGNTGCFAVNGTCLISGSVPTVSVIYLNGAVNQNGTAGTTTYQSTTIPANSLTTGTSLKINANLFNIVNTSGTYKNDIEIGNGSSSTTLAYYEVSGSPSSHSYQIWITAQTTSKESITVYTDGGTMRQLFPTFSTTGNLYISLSGSLDTPNGGSQYGVQGFEIDLF